MPHQQKLRHTADFTNIVAAAAQVINHNLHLDADNHPSLAVVPQFLEHMFYGADPGATSRVWYTAIGNANFTINWAGVNNLAGVNIRAHARILHSICQDFTMTDRPY